MDFNAFIDMLKTTFTEWKEDDVPRLAAALAYYTTFALAPILLIAITVAGLVIGESTATEQIMSQFEQLVGPSGARVIETAVENRGSLGSGIFTTVVGVIVLLVSATGVFNHLKFTLNRVWDIPKEKTEQGLQSMLITRLTGLGIILGTGFMLLISLVLTAAITAISDAIAGGLPIAQVLNFGLSLGVITLLFAGLYKALPDAEIQWRDVWVGAAFTALLFVIGKLLIGLYLGQSSVASTYGAAGSLVVVLLWTYFSAQIFLFGAEFTQVYSRRYGSKIMAEGSAQPTASLPVSTAKPAQAMQGYRHDPGFFARIVGVIGAIIGLIKGTVSDG